MHSLAIASTVLRRAVIAVLALAIGSACAQPTDADLLAAKAAFDRGDVRALDALAPRLAGHVLEPYVRYWHLRVSLETADPAAVAAFLDRERGTVLGDRLQLEWAKVLGRRGDWALFARHLPASTGDDVELACHAAQWRRQQDGDRALQSVRPLWYSGQATPEPCEPLFAALFARGELTVADRRTRLRLAAEAGNARLAQAIALSMPPSERIAERDLAAAERDPLRTLARPESLRSHDAAARDLQLYALERAARRDAAAAHDAWVRVRDLLPAADRRYGNARVAYHAARQLDPSADAYYREAEGAPLNDEQKAWRVRAALRAQSWPQVRAAIEAMPLSLLAQEPAWRYWRARALAATGRAGDAQPIFESLATEFHFYAHLAAEAIGRRVAPRSEPLPPSSAAQDAFGAAPPVQRARRLYALDLRAEALREWIDALRGADDERLLVAAQYARAAGMFDRAINTAERTASRHDFALRYLMPYADAFAAAAQEHDADPAMLFAIARQESRFSTVIVSSAGAAGLMQLMPGTARWVAKQLGRADYQPWRIADVDVNTAFGAFYFKHWLDRLDGRAALAAAAYNAGPSRAQAWRPPVALEGAIWVETIPFNETRDYVKKVLSNAMFYAQALDRPYVTLTERLGVIAPRARTDAAIAAGTP